jgi:uncharacterized membrane protein
MAKLLRNLAATLLFGVLLLVVVAYGFHSDVLRNSVYAQTMLHFLQLLALILWIGLLLAFNFIVQPGRPMGVFEGIADEMLADALIWSRYAALFAILTTLLPAFLAGNAGDVLLLRGEARVAGFGLWLMVIMAANLWLFIWPLQKRALGLIEAESDIRSNAAIVATIFSRINLMLVLPMLYCLVTADLGSRLQQLP